MVKQESTKVVVLATTTQTYFFINVAETLIWTPIARKGPVGAKGCRFFYCGIEHFVIEFETCSGQYFHFLTYSMKVAHH